MNVYLSFDGRCAEALDFYAACLGGQVLMKVSYADAPPGNEPVPEALRQRLMHGRIAARGMLLMGSDIPPDQTFEGYKGFQVSVQTEDADEGRKIFDALAAGGTVQMPYAKTFWSPGFGMLVDKFGVGWMVNSEPPQANS
ncbi:MAG: VOC family protein [Burkholderiaceae bacterium]|nr:VOC family protein [Burkholderiaceae bacterium]